MKKLTILFALIFALSAIGSSAQTVDNTAPEIRELIVTPDAVDVRTESKTVTVLARVTDAASGVSNVTLYIRPGALDYIIPLKLERVSGDANDGIYIGMINIVAYQSAERWVIGSVMSTDAAGNTVLIGNSEFAARGFAAGFQVISNSPPAPPFNKRKRVRFL